MTKAEVEKEFWWKHDLEKAFPPTRLDVFCKSKKIEEITSPNVLIWDWSFGQDFAAYAYELARRPGGKLKLRPYPELNHDESLFLFRTFGQNKDHAPKGAWRSDLKNPAEARNGYSEARRWRLDIPIGTLKAIFEKFILSQRQAQGIKQRIKSGSVAKPPAWKKSNFWTASQTISTGRGQ